MDFPWFSTLVGLTHSSLCPWAQVPRGWGQPAASQPRCRHLERFPGEVPRPGSGHGARARLQTAPRGLHQPASTAPTSASPPGLHRSGEHGSGLCGESRGPGTHVQPLWHGAGPGAVGGAFPQPVQGNELLGLLHGVQHTRNSRTCPRHHGRVEPVPSVPLRLLVNGEDPSQ